MLFYKEKTGENMELDNINIGNGLELAQIGNPIPNECFKELVETIRDCYKRLGIKTEEMLYIGDHPRNDIEGSRNAGFVPVWVKTTGTWIFPEIEKPELQVETVEEIPTLIDKINNR